MGFRGSNRWPARASGVAYDFTSEAAHGPPTGACVETRDLGLRETDRAQSSTGVDRRARILGRLDPVLATVIRWADEDPVAMARLIEDVGLRVQLGRTLEGLEP